MKKPKKPTKKEKKELITLILADMQELCFSAIDQNVDVEVGLDAFTLIHVSLNGVKEFMAELEQKQARH